MLTIPHILVGLGLIKTFPNFWGVILAFLSHFIFDFCLPHWNPHIFTEIKKNGQISQKSLTMIIFDGLGAITITLLLVLSAFPNYKMAFFFALGAFVAILPDLIEIPYYFFKSQNPLLKKYVYFEHMFQANAGPFWGILTQLLVILASFKVIAS